MLQYIIVFIWGLLTVLAFVGWGEVVNRLAGRPQGDGADHGPDWGLKTGWGMALALFVGGGAALLGIATTAFAISFVLVGAVLQLSFLARPRFSVEILRDPRFSQPVRRRRSFFCNTPLGLTISPATAKTMTSPITPLSSGCLKPAR